MQKMASILEFIYMPYVALPWEGHCVCSYAWELLFALELYFLMKFLVLKFGANVQCFIVLY